MVGSVGCDAGRGSILVSLCGDLLVPGDVDAFRISILDDARVERQSGVVELIECPADTLRTLPLNAQLGTVSGSVWVVVQGLKDGVEVARFEQRSTTDEGGGALVRMVLTQECMGVSCSLGQTCVAGECVLTPWESPPGGCPVAVTPLEEDVVTPMDDVTEDVTDDVTSDAPLYCPAEGGGQGGGRGR